MITSPSTGANSKAWDFVEPLHPDQRLGAQEHRRREPARVRRAATEDAQQAVLDAAAAAEARGWEMSKAETEAKVAELQENGIDRRTSPARSCAGAAGRSARRCWRTGRPAASDGRRSEILERPTRARVSRSIRPPAGHARRSGGAVPSQRAGRRDARACSTSVYAAAGVGWPALSILAICLMITAQVGLNVAGAAGRAGMGLDDPVLRRFRGLSCWRRRTFLALAYTLRLGAHIRVKLLVQRLPDAPALGRRAGALALAVGVHRLRDLVYARGAGAGELALRRHVHRHRRDAALDAADRRWSLGLGAAGRSPSSTRWSRALRAGRPGPRPTTRAE